MVIISVNNRVSFELRMSLGSVSALLPLTISH